MCVDRIRQRTARGESSSLGTGMAEQRHSGGDTGTEWDAKGARWPKGEKSEQRHWTARLGLRRKRYTGQEDKMQPQAGAGPHSWQAPQGGKSGSETLDLSPQLSFPNTKSNGSLGD